MRSGKTPQAHERHRHRDLSDFGQLSNFIGGIGKHRAASDVDHRLFRLHDLFGGLFDLLFIAGNARVIAAQVDFLGIFKFRFCRAHVLGNIDQNRPRPALGRDIECLFDRLRQIVNVFHEHVMLRARTADTDIISFLKSIVADQVR